MKLEFQEYKSRKIVNVHKHVDAWFWDKYSAHPYIGCRSGCEFCYARGGYYLGKRDPATFDTLIQVKINAVELLRKELARLSPDVICCGDWQQPTEDRYRLSRGMLEVVRDSSFPLFIVERSPLLARDLDLLVDINRRAWVGVVFSLSSLDPALKHAFEPRNPGVKRRLQAIATLTNAGILAGVSLMPILPLVGDDESHLDDVIRAVKDHGGAFVLAGSLTLDGIQANRTLAAARQLNPALAKEWRTLYNWAEGEKPAYSPPPPYSARLGLLVRDFCARYGLRDRMPRYIAPGPLAVNKRLAERLFLKTYDLELAQTDDYRIWAYRRAAWTVDEWPESLAGIYTTKGEAGLRALPGLGQGMAKEIAGWL
jgi:DNA repair photolyase